MKLLKYAYMLTFFVFSLASCANCGSWTQLSIGTQTQQPVLVNDHQGNLYMTSWGLWDPITKLWRYNIQNNQWQQLTNFSGGGIERNASFYDGNGHIYMNRGNWSNQFLMYDINAMTWSYKATPPTSRMMYNAGAFDGNRYGFFTGGMWDASLYRYDVLSNSWNILGALPETMAYNTMIYDGQENLFMNVGTYDNAPNNVQKRFYRYNIQSNIWTRMRWTPFLTSAYTPGLVDVSGNIVFWRHVGLTP